MNRPSLLRDTIGFVVGGTIGSAAAGIVYIEFVGLPTGAHNGEDSAPLAVLILFMFFAGGFVGRRGLTADFRSDFYPSIIGSYIVAVFLCLTAGLSFAELSAMIGFATVGILASVVISLLLMR